MARSSPAGRKVGLKRVLAGLTLICLGSLSLVSLGASGASAQSNESGGNEACPTGSTLIAKFEWSGQSYVFEKPDGNDEVVEITDGTASGGSWTSSEDVGYVIVKGGSGSKPGTVATSVTVPTDPNQGTFGNEGLDNRAGEDVNHPDVSNVQFCGPTETLTWDLTVAKTLSGNAQPATWDQTFLVDCGDYAVGDVAEEGEGADEGGNLEIDLDEANTSDVVSGIPDGTDCTVEETTADPFAFATTSAVDPGEAADFGNDNPIAVTMDADHDVVFNNAYNSTAEDWDLTISKAVRGNAAPSEWSFDFVVDCGDYAVGEVVEEGEGADEGGNAVVTLTNLATSGGIDDIPDSETCTVTEDADDAAGYVVSPASGVVNVSSSSTSAAFTNTKSVVVADDFDYECSAATGVTRTGATLHGDTDDPSVSAATFTVFDGDGEVTQATDNDGSNGWSARATGLRADTEYTYNVNWGSSTQTSGECSFVTDEPLPVVEPPGPPPTTPPVVAPGQQNRPPQVLGEVFTNNPPAVAPAVLARTGSSTSPLVAVAAALILLGILMLVPFRRHELQG